MKFDSYSQGHITVQIQDEVYRVSNETGTLVCEYASPSITAKQIYQDFIKTRTVMDTPGTVKRVFYDATKGEYFQMQAVLINGTYELQRYDADLNFEDFQTSDFQYEYEVTDFWDKYYAGQQVKGIWCSVFKDNLTCHDKRKVYIPGATTNETKPVERYLLVHHRGGQIPYDIRDVLVTHQRNEYVYCQPVAYPRKWYMASGKFLYSTHSAFTQDVSPNPIAIHNRTEEKANG